MRLTNLLYLRITNIAFITKSKFIPKHNPVRESDIKLLENFLKNRKNILVLTGAGISTESGIPDYRSENVGLYARSNIRPTQHQDFIKSLSVRKRYWARNFLAWPKFSEFEPNIVHHTLTRFERDGLIQGIVTQNVDNLHTKAKTKNLIELHGCGYTVKCLDCDYKILRHDFQHVLNTLNKNLFEKVKTDNIRPDGDIDLSQEIVDNFILPSCPNCDGNLLKPDIVFFGDNVPMSRILDVTKMICQSDGLLVLGSSLIVFSGYRMVLQTLDVQQPVAIINIGPTRADDKATIKISARCGDILPKLFL